MMSKLLIVSLACLALAQSGPAITDVLGQAAPPMGAAPVQPSQQVPGTGPAGVPPVVQQPVVPQPGFGGAVGPFAGGAGQAMASLLTGITQAGTLGAPGQVPGANGGVTSGALSEDSMQVVSGLIEAFMHKAKLEPGEKSCLTRNMGALTGDIMGTVMDIVNAVKVLIAGNGSVKKNESGNMVEAGIDSAMKITSLVTSATSLFKGCVHGDALALLNKTASHFINGSYIQHRLLVNGVDIARAISDSIISFESHNFHQFGVDIGVSLRKVLLSDATNGTRLPEGMPEQGIIQKTMDGLMKGFFVQGAALRITDQAMPDVDIRVDLHMCIAGNSEFFKELWMAMWDLFAKLAVNAEQHQLGNMFQAGKQQPRWAGEFMIAMMQIPMALSRCGIAGSMQQMLMEAVKTLGDLKVQFRFPQDNIGAVDSTERMAQAIEAWTNFNFEGFGYEIGTLLRELVLMAFPQQYSVDHYGRLQRFTQDNGALLKPGALASSSAIIAGASISLLVSFALVRATRSGPLRTQPRELTSDIEDCSNDLAVE